MESLKKSLSECWDGALPDFIREYVKNIDIQTFSSPITSDTYVKYTGITTNSPDLEEFQTEAEKKLENKKNGTKAEEILENLVKELSKTDEKDSDKTILSEGTGIYSVK